MFNYVLPFVAHDVSLIHTRPLHRAGTSPRGLLQWGRLWAQCAQPLCANQQHDKESVWLPWIKDHGKYTIHRGIHQVGAWDKMPEIIIQNGWLHWLVTRYGGFFFQAEELNLDLGQRKGFPFGNTGVLCLPDTITSRVLVGTLAKTKIRVAFSHPSAYPGWWGPRWERLSGAIVTGSALRMLVTLSPKSAVTEL